MNRIGLVAATAVLALSGCGASEETTAQVCDGLTQAQQGLSSLTTSAPETVGDAKKQVAEVKANLEAAIADAPIAQQAVLTGIAQAVDGIAQSLSAAKDSAQVPEAVTQAVDSVSATIDTAATTVGCG